MLRQETSTTSVATQGLERCDELKLAAQGLERCDNCDSASWCHPTWQHPDFCVTLASMGNDREKPQEVQAELEHDDAFQVLVDLGHDLAAGAARVAETIPTEKVQRAAAKAVILGHATAQVAGKARKVAQEVAHLGERSQQAIDDMERHGVPVRSFWRSLTELAQVTTTPLPRNRGPDVHIGPQPRAVDQVPPPRVKIDVRPVSAPAPAPVSMPDEPGVVSPSDPRRGG